MRNWFWLAAVLALPFMTVACNDNEITGPPPISGDTIRLASGLKYIQIKQGQGAPAVAGRRVSVHYTGYLAEDGTRFDTSLVEDRNPLSFVLNSSGAGAPIRGFNDGILGMNVGGKRRLFIPAALAYGANPPAGSGIPENADLIFDVELFSVSAGT